MGKKFNRCVKSVRKTVKARKGSTKESAAIAICTTTVLHPRGRTLKRYRKGRLMTQKRKARRGGQMEGETKPGFLTGLKTKANAALQTVRDKASEKIQNIKRQFEPETPEEAKRKPFTLRETKSP